MTSRKVTQYKCDFCGKRKYSSPAMKKHEKHCTLNPNRSCRMCDIVHVKHNMGELLAILPPPIRKENDEWGDNVTLLNRTEIETALVELRELADECPACILAALRQKGIHPMSESGYDYAKERKEFWEYQNRERPETYY
jgi:hypothetical protein